MISFFCVAALIDSGSAGKFVSRATVTAYGFPVERLPERYPVHLWKPWMVI